MPHSMRPVTRPLFALCAALLLLLPRSAAHAGAFADSLVRADPTLTADLLPLPQKVTAAPPP